jgi:putative phosphonate metabolism protein
MRYAIYFTPDQSDKLTRAAAAWLGRDAFTGEESAPPAAAPLSAEEIIAHVKAPRRYGFHATLKAPFRLAEGRSEEDLVAALAGFAADTAPVLLPKVVLRQLDGFFAIVPEEGVPELERLAADIVEVFEPFRAPLTDAEIAARNPARLTAAQLENLHRWGYPYVLEHFRFHMTLTDRVAPDEASRVEQALASFFGPFIDRPLEIGAVALFVEPERGAPFTVRSFHRLEAQEQRKTA